jgi:hypothetical protein
VRSAWASLLERPLADRKAPEADKKHTRWRWGRESRQRMQCEPLQGYKAVSRGFRAEPDYILQIFAVFALAGVLGTGAGAGGLQKLADPGQKQLE